MEDYIHPDDRPLVAEAIRQAIGSKGVFELEHRVRRPDGGLGWTLSRAVPILGADGGVVEWFGAASDVTARRDAEERLRASEARWRGLFGSMQEGFAYCEMVYDAEGRAVDYRHLELNAAWGRLTGVPNEEVQGKLVSEAIPGIEPFWLETYARVVETGEPAHFEHRLAVYGRWFEVMAYRTEPGRFAAVFSNITERKAAEARRDALVELGDCLRDLRDPAEIARTAAEVIGRALGAVRAGYGTVDAAGEVFRIERCWTDGRAPGVAGELRVADFWADLAAEHGRGGVVAIDDAARDPRTAGRAGAYAALGLRAFLDVPVVEAGRVAAILFVHDASPRAWTAEEVAFARGAADRAWAAAVRARAEAALREGERRLQATQDHAGVGITEIDAEGRYARVNQTYARLSGWAAAGLAGRAYWDLIEDGGGREEARRDFGRLVRGEVDGLDARREYTGRCGRRWWAEITARAIRDERGRFLYAVRVVQDITERKRAEDALRDGERRLRATQDHAGVGIHEVDAEGRYARVSATFTRMTGYTVEDLAGRSTWDLIEDEADRREARAAFARLVRGEADGTTERLHRQARAALVGGGDHHGGARRGRAVPVGGARPARHHRTQAGRGAAVAAGQRVEPPREEHARGGAVARRPDGARRRGPARLLGGVPGAPRGVGPRPRPADARGLGGGAAACGGARGLGAAGSRERPRGPVRLRLRGRGAAAAPSAGPRAGPARTRH
jgi:PAS domain S-box-containing protein